MKLAFGLSHQKPAAVCWNVDCHFATTMQLHAETGGILRLSPLVPLPVRQVIRKGVELEDTRHASSRGTSALS